MEESSSSSSMDYVFWPVATSTHCHRFLGPPISLPARGLYLRAYFGSLVFSILSRWLIQFCLYLDFTSCIAQICSSFLNMRYFWLHLPCYPQQQTITTNNNNNNNRRTETCTIPNWCLVWTSCFNPVALTQHGITQLRTSIQVAKTNGINIPDKKNK